MGHTSGIATDIDNVWTTATACCLATSLPINFNIRASEQQGRNYLGYGTPGGAWRSRGFQSHHPGGAQVAMCDGSVHFIEESIQQRTLNAMGSRAGGETVEFDF